MFFMSHSNIFVKYNKLQSCWSLFDYVYIFKKCFVVIYFVYLLQSFKNTTPVSRNMDNSANEINEDVDNTENEIEAIAERIKLLRKNLLNSGRQKRSLLAELVQLLKVQDRMKIQLDEELAREKVLLDRRTERQRHFDECTRLLKFSTLESLEKTIISIPLNRVEEQSSSLYIPYTPVDDPNNTPVKLEEVHLCDEQYPEEFAARRDSLRESTVQKKKLGPSDPQHACANQLMDVDNMPAVKLEEVNFCDEQDMEEEHVLQESTILEENPSNYYDPPDSRHANQSMKSSTLESSISVCANTDVSDNIGGEIETDISLPLDTAVQYPNNITCAPDADLNNPESHDASSHLEHSYANQSIVVFKSTGHATAANSTNPTTTISSSSREVGTRSKTSNYISSMLDNRKTNSSCNFF